MLNGAGALGELGVLLSRWGRGGRACVEGAYGDGKELGRAADYLSDAGGIALAAGAAPEAVCEHCDHPEGDFALRRAKRHGALGFGCRICVEALGFARVAVTHQRARGGCELSAPLMVLEPRHRAPRPDLCQRASIIA